MYMPCPCNIFLIDDNLNGGSLANTAVFCVNTEK
jgi:hypothetical protein